VTNRGDDAWGVIGTPRTIHTPEGEWRIFEFRSPFYEPGKRVLVFHALASDAMYRATDYSRDWHFLSDEELMAVKRDSPAG
jgi:hypothetical protein